MEAFALMREELRQVRTINADLLAALADIVAVLGTATLDDCERQAWTAHEIARAALAAATGAKVVE